LKSYRWLRQISGDMYCGVPITVVAMSLACLKHGSEKRVFEKKRQL
jgi:hypothetical protein